MRMPLGAVTWVLFGVWFAVAGHSPVWAAREVAGGQCVLCRLLTRPSGRRLFCSRQGLGSLPGAHTSILTTSVS